MTATCFNAKLTASGYMKAHFRGIKAWLANQDSNLKTDSTFSDLDSTHDPVWHGLKSCHLYWHLV